MSFLHPITRPLRRVFAAVFQQHLSVKVAKEGVRVVLQDRPAVPAKDQPPSRAELAARKERQDFQLMLQQLADLLNELPETRSTMRHLVFVEQALERKGLKALNKLPVDLLRRALDQLEGLVVNWSPVGLATLRSRMAVALIDRDHLDPADAEAEAYKTSAVMETLPNSDFQRGLEVSTDDEALAAAYAALGDLAPTAGVGIQPELPAGGSTAAASLPRGDAVPPTGQPGEIRVHVLNG